MTERYTAELDTKGSGALYAVYDHQYPHPDADGQKVAVWIHNGIEGPPPSIPAEYTHAILTGWFRQQQALAAVGRWLVETLGYPYDTHTTTPVPEGAREFIMDAWAWHDYPQGANDEEWDTARADVAEEGGWA